MSKEKTSTKEWAGAFAAYKPSSEAMKLNASVILILILVNIGLEILLQALFDGSDSMSNLISLLLSPLFTMAIYSGVYGKKIKPEEIIDKTKPFYVQLVIASFLVSLSLIASLILLIIPFFFVMPRVVLTPYFLINKKLDAVEALKMSWEKTKPHQGKIWGIIGAMIVMALPAITIIGIPLAVYFVFMYSASSAVLFKHIVK